MFKFLWYFHFFQLVWFIEIRIQISTRILLHLTPFEAVLNPPLIIQFEIYLQSDKNIRWGSLQVDSWMICIHCFVSILLIVLFIRNTQEVRRQIFLGYLWTWNLCYCFGYIANKPQVYSTGASGNGDRDMMTVNCP